MIALIMSMPLVGEKVDRDDYRVLTVTKSGKARGEGDPRDTEKEVAAVAEEIDGSETLPPIRFQRQLHNHSDPEGMGREIKAVDDAEEISSFTAYSEYCSGCRYCESYTFSADWLFWKGEQDGLDYARSGYSANGSANVGGPGRVYDPDWRWQSGVRVGLKKRFHCSAWTAFATYTHYNTEAVDHVTDPDNSQLRKIWDSPHFFEDDIDEASTEWGLNFNNVDIGIGKDYCFCSWLNLHPHFGFKGVWQKQDYHTTYIAIEEDTSTNAIDHHVDFYGVGLRAGLDSSWEITPCLSLLGNVAFNSIWGHFSIDRKDQLTIEGEISSDAVTFLASRERYTLIPAMELFIGLRWESLICGRYPLFSQIGWEHQIWYDMNQFLKTSVDSHHAYGNLTMHGLTWKFGWRY